MYEIIIACDREGCNVTTEVPQVGALPMNWIGMASAPTVPVNPAPGSPPQQVDQKFYCCDVCAHKVLTKRLNSKAAVDKPVRRKKTKVKV